MQLALLELESLPVQLVLLELESLLELLVLLELELHLELPESEPLPSHFNHYLLASHLFQD